jgi:hypothetical protein
MKMKNEDIDRLTAQMIHIYGKQNNLHDTTPSTQFMARLRARIRRSQNGETLWETSVIKAQRWLVGLSFIALAFFISNLALAPTSEPSSAVRLTPETIAATDFDVNQLNEALLFEDLRQD